MSKPIEDYALLSDGRSSALVSKEGSIDWLCAPRFDSAAVFARLLGREEHGFWSIRPRGDFRVERRYVDDTLVLETRFVCGEAEAILEDALIVDSPTPLLVRSLRGVRGRLTNPPVRSSRLPPPPCQKRSAAAATGTIAIAGCAIPLFPSTR